MKKLPLLVSALCGTFYFIPAAALTPIHLKDAIIQAQSISPRAEISDLQIDLAKAHSKQARAKTGFQIGIEGELGASYVDFTINDANLTPNQIGIGAKRVLYSSGQLNAGIKRSAYEIKAAEYSGQQTRNSVSVITAITYGNLWFAEQVVDIHQQKAETLRLHLREAEARLVQGKNTKTDIYFAKARLAGAEAELAGANARHSAASASLSRLSGVGQPKTTIRDLDTIIAMPVTRADSSVQIFADYPKLRAEKAKELAATQGITEARAGFGPKVTLGLSAGTAQDSFFFFTDRVNEAKIALKLSMPLYTSGMKKASTSAARLQKAMAKAQIRDTALRLQEQYSSLHGRLSARRAALVAARRGVEAATNRTVGIRKEYEAGFRTFVDLMDAEDERRTAEIALSAAKRDLFTTKIQLLDLTGDLNSQLAQGH